MKTARWTARTTLVDVVKAIVEHIDNPDIDYAINFGSFFLLETKSIISFIFL